jgi:hypothetical protein
VVPKPSATACQEETMKPMGAWFAMLVFLGLPVVAQQSTAVADLPPIAVKTVPQSGELAVDPALKEITVTFSKDMMTNQMWSWAQIDAASFPKLAGKPRFLSDKRTCVLPVHLEPGRSYALWVNSGSFNNFRDLGNRPAVPYLIAFQTKP